MLYLIRPDCGDPVRAERLEALLTAALDGQEVEELTKADELIEHDLSGKRILFAICLTRQGINLEYTRMLAVIRTNRLAGRFSGSVGAVIVDGAGELYTKAVARELVFAANRAGMVFPGKALVEGTGSLYNFELLSSLLDMDREEAYRHQMGELVKKLLSFEVPGSPEKILTIHAGNKKTSNSLMIWEKVKAFLERKPELKISEIGLLNGEIIDCRGCPYETCLHFGESGQCFYGGVMVDQVYPALLEADTLIMVCPNYNDAVSANIMAFINRLTALFRSNDFSAKRFYAIVVSGYSGGDIVCQQIIGAMNFNKNMYLPADFALIETANLPGSILNLEGVDVRAEAFAGRVLNQPSLL